MNKVIHIDPSPPDPLKKQPDLKWIKEISFLMDKKFTFPGTKFKFGLDPIFGLIPFLGDLLSFGISITLVMYMTRFGVSRKVMIMMAGNILLDATVGSIPILGSIFDFYYKANTRNLEILRRHYEEGKYQGSGKGMLFLIFLILIIVVAVIIFLSVKLYQFIISLF